MSIKVECSSCGHRYQVGDNMAGKKVKCKTCQAIITIPAAGEDEFDFGAINVEEPVASPAASQHSRAGAKPPKSAPRQFEDEDEDHREGDGEPGLPESSAAYVFPGSEALETFLPILLAVAGLGWMVVQAYRAEDTVHGWVGPFRAAVYLFAYVAIVFPFALMGVTAAGKKAYFPMPDSYRWRTFATFCLPAALAAIFTLINWSVPMFIVGIVLGMVVSLTAFIFLFSLRSHQVGKALSAASVYVLLGTILGAAVLFGINFLVMASLTFNKSAHEYAVSPLGPQFAWNPPAVPEEPAVKKKKSGEPAPLVENTTQPATEAATQPVAVAVTQPSGVGPSATTQIAIATNSGPTTQSSTQPVTQLNSEPPPVAPVAQFSPLLTAAPAPLPIGPMEEAFLPNQTGGSTILALLTHANFGDAFEVWNAVNGAWIKTETFDAAPKTSDHSSILLNAKGNAMARIVDFPRPAIEVRPLSGDPAADQARVHRIEPDAARTGGLAALLFTSNGSIVAMTSGNVAALDVYDPLRPIGNQQARMPVPLTGLTPTGHCNVVVTPDARHVASIRNVPPGAGPNPPGNYIVIDGIAGTNTFEKYNLTSLQPDRPVAVTGLAVSPDGGKVALLYQENQDGLIEIFKIPDGKQLGRNIFHGPAGVPIADFQGSALSWFADGTAFLINGRYVIDADNFSEMGDLGIENVKAQHVVDRETVLLLVPDAGTNKPRIMQAKLDASKFRTAATKPTPGRAINSDPHAVVPGH